MPKAINRYNIIGINNIKTKSIIESIIMKNWRYNFSKKSHSNLGLILKREASTLTFVSLLKVFFSKIFLTDGTFIL